MTLVITLLSAAIIITAAGNSSLRMKSAHIVAESQKALLYAQMGLDISACYLPSRPDWRGKEMPANVFLNVVYEDGFLTVEASDPGDGILEVDGKTDSSDADTIRLKATAKVGDFTRTIQADYLPLPIEALGYVLLSHKKLELNNGGYIEGRIRCNDHVTTDGFIDLYGNVTTVTGKSIDAGLIDENTTAIYADQPITFPVVDFDWFEDAGTSIKHEPKIENTRITTTFAPGVAAKDFGQIYYIDCGGKDIRLHNLYVNACLVLIDAHNVFIGDKDTPYDYVHISPDPTRLPALLVEGEVRMYINGGVLADAITGCGDQESRLEGLFYATKKIEGPQKDASGAIEVIGSLMADEIILQADPQTTIKHDIRMNSAPIIDFVQPVMVSVPGSYQEL